ncbi:MAG: histidinol dehydrogenase [Candidatus Omnitrophica bacterium CG11_big_fil_rev_8_21_14_0_20_64_10]|nr:MAG: histidinol dehydrogenase [Candidatus Omnitrophica bacterium CG11_big_fil_rev_8_21_14_0_20_64_10]
MRVVRVRSQEWEKLVNRGVKRRPRVEQRVRTILEAVRLEGDTALLRFTRQFDRVALKPRQLKVTEAETSAAFQNISPKFISALRTVIDNVNKFYRDSAEKSWKRRDKDGVILGEQVIPLGRVGVYVPSGTAPLVSTVYMSVLPAKIAGVQEVILCTPPKADGSVDPHILVVASLLKVNAIYKIGGAQAIAAMAFGTRTVPVVDKIVGPGNAYVTEAKRQVYGYTDIDMTAGPTEIAVLANRSANPEFVARDLEAENEHHQGLAMLVTTSKALAQTIRKQVSEGVIILVKNLNEAVEVVNQLAPEHLEIHIKRPEAILKKIRTAGTIFLGPWSPASVGDYVAGPSHVLPTGGSARFFSGLGVRDFYRVSHLIGYSRKALEASREQIERLALIEGLPKHAASVTARFGKEVAG